MVTCPRFRQLDRLTDENESLLQQMDTYCSQLKAVALEKSSLQNKLESSKDQALRVMELEANIICFKEKEKDFQNKLKALEADVNKERKTGAEKDLEIRAMRERLEKSDSEMKELKRHLDEKSVEEEGERSRKER